MNLIDFYRNESPTPEGLTFSDFMQYGYEQLEGDHAWIQWILPTKEPSAFNPDAPLLTDEDRVLFKSDPVLIENYLAAVYHVLDFFDMSLFRGEPMWKLHDERCPRRWWLESFNHNFLRMTRLLTSLRYMGYDDFALSIFALLEEYRDIYPNSVEQHWGPAVMEALE